MTKDDYIIQVALENEKLRNQLADASVTACQRERRIVIVTGERDQARRAYRDLQEHLKKLADA